MVSCLAGVRLLTGLPVGHALTRREREVLALLADGLSNAAIAGRLDVSEGTVEVHVSHILGKLGVENRSHAAAWAAKHNLAGSSGGGRD